ncbi:death-on-curing family protein [Desulfovibrio sp. X2]|uniref:type II toxin-antitoxin system death-on-curing family toxin n=1 Tax=Desulfovibrio sp. X2 TaxID=941449 RepID=UPI0003587ADB|nr:type II toxin-antitoxin system death-on-curing family toxin [Desulfovibrio sp. X2]EPR44477.1 death-on-curing family protein [Desulfovibrio sp. X2]
MSKVTRLTEEEVVAIRKRMAETEIAQKDAFGPVEPWNKDRLASAVFRQYTGVGEKYKYNTVPEVAATLFYGIAMSHAFENGNKRTATVSMLIMLDKNRHMIVDTTEKDLYDLAKSLVTHSLLDENTDVTPDNEVDYIAGWIRERSRERVLGEQIISFPQLRAILEDMGCTFDAPYKNFIKIKKGGLSVKTGYPRPNFELSISEIKRIRRGLHLDELHGTDTSGFYNLGGQVDIFINKYRNLMKWLADL